MRKTHKKRSREISKPAQIRHWMVEQATSPDIDMFFVIDCTKMTSLDEQGVSVMYPDGFITVHSKREVEFDSWVIC